MLGHTDEAAATLDAASRIAEELRQPGHFWFVRAIQAMLALAEGRLGDADALVDQAQTHGASAQPDMAAPVYAVQRHTLCDFRGGLEDVESVIREMAECRPARPMFRCVLAQLHARLGRHPEAQRALDELADDDFSALPFDQEWLYSMSLLAETAALLHDRDCAGTLYRLLLPWATLSVVDQCEGIRGSLSRDLGVLATVTADLDPAEQHFEHAVAMDARMGFRPWHARAEDHYARMLVVRDRRGDRPRARELLGSALTTYQELGMDSYARIASASVQRIAASP
jgi:tetratricopeptide (TPR) repeat protein